jgi:hypothetical protein
MTTPTFTDRSNARRAARRMIEKGEAPSDAFEIFTRRPDCHEIVWLTAAPTTSTDAIETEIAAAAAAADQPAPAAALVFETENKWPDDTAVLVRVGLRLLRATIVARIREAAWQVRWPAGDLGIAAAKDIRRARKAPAGNKPKKPAARRATPAATAEAKTPRSKYGADPAAIAAGKLPAKPVINSPTNPSYQKKVDALAELAEKGDWAAVAAYPVSQSNATYPRIVRRYHEQLLAAHAAQQGQGGGESLADGVARYMANCGL